MFFGYYDLSLARTNSVGTVGSRKDRKAEEREGSISSHSTSERRSSTWTAERSGSVFGGFFHRKLAKKEAAVELSTPTLPTPSSIATNDGGAAVGGGGRNGSASPEPTAAQVVRDVHSNGNEAGTQTTKNFKRLNVRPASYRRQSR